MTKRTDPRRADAEKPIQGHRYDGIREYDNPMPGWWVWLFWATVAFSLFYYVGITFFDFVNTYEDDLAESLVELETRRASFAESAPSFTPDATTLQEYVDDDVMARAGAGVYSSYCAACHGNEGQGVIGPNLTDEYWIHGGSAEEIFEVITKGVPEKGLTPWEGVLTPEQRAQLVSFVRSIEGTNPPNPKEPQGEING